MANTIKILLANDHKLLCEGIRSAFAKQASHIQVVCSVETFEELLKVLPITDFDILLVDDRMHGQNFMTFLPNIKEQYPELKIIIHSIITDDVPHLVKAMELTKGRLSFCSEPEDYVEAVETVYNGGHYYYKGLKKEA